VARPHPVLIDLAACRTPPRRVPDPEVLVRSAVEHRMYGLLWSAVERDEVELPVALERRLGLLFLRTREHHRRLWEALGEVTALLAAEGIEVATFKGVTAERRWYDRMGERPCRDLDLWLSPHQLGRAGDVVRLLQPDHPLRDDLQSLVDRRLLQSIDLAVAGVAVDFHFDPFKLGVWTPNLPQIWDRTVEVDGARALGEADAAVQLLLHLVKDRFSWLIGLADVPRLSIPPTDLDAVATEGGVECPVNASYATVQVLLSTSDAEAARVPWAWRLTWPRRLFLDGDPGWLRARHRQVWIPLFGRFPTVMNLRALGRVLLPPRPLVDHWYPDEPGAYLPRLVRGRIRRALERRASRRRPPYPGVVGVQTGEDTNRQPEGDRHLRPFESWVEDGVDPHPDD